MAPKIITAAKADESTGAVVYWTMSGPCGAAALADEWSSAGLDPAWLPKPASAKDALRRACADLADGATLVRKHKAGGWIVVGEQWAPGADKPTYDPGVHFALNDAEEIQITGESPHAATIRAAYAAARSAIATQDFSAWLVRIVGGKLGGALLRETGGIYFIPAAAMPEFAKVKAAIAAASAHYIYEIPAVKSAEAVAAVFAAIQREVAETIAALEFDIAQETIRGTTLLDRLRACNEMGVKVGVYERLFGAPCGNAMGALASIAKRLRALAAAKDKDANDRFAMLEIEIVRPLPPDPVDPAIAPYADRFSVAAEPDAPVRAAPRRGRSIRSIASATATQPQAPTEMTDLPRVDSGERIGKVEVD